MKKIQNKAILCAMALVAATGFVSCSSDEVVAEAPVNPTYDGNSVKTQFAINVAKANGTRMSADDTQNNSNYLGMENVRLFTLATAPAASQNVTSDIKLTEPTSVTLTGTARSSHIYSDVNIPVGTNNFLFYSTRKSIANNGTTGAIGGSLLGTGSATIANTDEINFTGVMIKTAKTTEISEVRTAFAAYLNSIITAFGETPTDPNLTTAKTNFTANFTNAQRAGSAFAILKQVEQIYRIADASTDTGTGNAIKTAITNGETIKTTATTTDGVTTLAYNIDDKYANFPNEQGLPEGAMLLTYESGQFKYTEGNPNYGIGGDKKVNMNNIMYPLPIVYFDNTPAKAKDESLLVNQWPTTTTDWDASIISTNGWGNQVLASTHSIALENNINYGVAGLKTTILCTKTQLEDNAVAYNGNSSVQNIDVPASGFPVTGLLIGGQPSQVGWQMIDETATNPNRDYVIYDDVTNGAVAKHDEKSTNIYTLVFDNWQSGNQDGVNIAIELENNSGKAFYGQDGMIEKGQKFYLIGQLVLDDAKKTSFSWPTYGTGSTDLKDSYQGRYPVKADDSGKRIFIQDYTTEANFKITSLKNAYVTIPDLRATKLQLGLSVDLEWKAGMKFDVEL